MTDRRTPVVVGVGQVVQRDAAPDGGLDALGLMVEAARCAGEDAGAPELLGRVGTVLVPQGTWPHGDAGRLVAEAVGAEGAWTVLARVGVLQTTPLARAAADVAAGRVDVALVVGGEARARAAAARRDGTRAAETPAPPGDPDEDLVPTGEIVTGLEIERGLAVPAQSYAVQEQALRHRRGESVSEHRDRLARLWAALGAVAADHPFAWDGAPARPEAIADPAAPGNRMVASPYTRRHCSQWNVDQAVALLLCASGTADDLGVPAGRRVHPLAVVESNAMIPVSRRAELHRSPAFAVAGGRLAALTGVHPAEADHLDLYSCFPSAVQIQAAELGIDAGRDLTVTGGMTFAGGPFNSYALHAVASMVEVVRRDPGATGLVSAISGMITKQGLSLWSTDPPRSGFAVADVSEEAAAATATLDVDPDHTGTATVDGSTVAFDREGAALAVVVATTRDGRRVVASSDDRELAASKAEDPRTGEDVRVDGPVLLG